MEILVFTRKVMGRTGSLHRPHARDWKPGDRRRSFRLFCGVPRVLRLKSMELTDAISSSHTLHSTEYNRIVELCLFFFGPGKRLGKVAGNCKLDRLSVKVQAHCPMITSAPIFCSSNSGSFACPCIWRVHVGDPRYRLRVFPLWSGALDLPLRAGERRRGYYSLEYWDQIHRAPPSSPIIPLCAPWGWSRRTTSPPLRGPVS